MSRERGWDVGERVERGGIAGVGRRSWGISIREMRESQKRAQGAPEEGCMYVCIEGVDDLILKHDNWTANNIYECVHCL